MKITKPQKIKMSSRTALVWSCAAMMTLQLAASAQTLVNRYSFSDTDDGAGDVGAAVLDSVGGPTWNGILPTGGYFTGSQLILTGGSQQYVKLPQGVLSNYTAVTIDTWATFGQLPVNCFYFGFGATDTNGGAGYNYIFCAPQGGRIAITGVDPGYTGEQGCGGAGDLSLQTVHLTAVFNPPAGYIALYTNGVLISQNDSVTVPMTSISNMLAYIGRSLYPPDPWPDISLDEFRIYNGSLSPLQVAANDVSGPDDTSSSYGTVTSLQMQLSSPIAIGASTAPATVTVTATGLPNPVLLSVPDGGVTYTSSDSTIATVNSTNGAVTGVSSGTVNIVASYDSLSATQSVQVIALPTTMIHRYSFNEDTTNNGDVVHDSIGNQNGTFFNDSGLSSISGGQLNLSGLDKGDYVDLGSYLISSTNIPNNAATFEAWATMGPDNGIWTRLWEFGAFQAGGVIGSSGGQDYWSFMPSQNPANLARMELSHGGNVDVNNLGDFLGRTNVHVVGVFNPNPSRQFFGVYINGAFVNSSSTGGRPFSSINDVYSWLGRSLWSGDSAFEGSIDEFRIYNGELNRFQIAASYQAGPNQTNFNVGTFTSFDLSAGTLPIPLSSFREVNAYMNFSQATNVLVNGDLNLSFSSDKPSVASITAGGLLTATGLGTANISATYNYIVGATTNTYSASIPVTTYRDLPAQMDHRYSFNDGTANDSVGTANGTLMGDASISGGQLVLPNTNNVAALDYLQLPAGIVTNDPACTIEAWATIYPAQWTWANLFDFGSQDVNGQAAYDIHSSVHAGGNATITGISDSDNANVDYQFVSTPTVLDGSTNIHIVCVFDPPAGYIAVYTNSVLMGYNNQITIQMSGVQDVLNKIGADLWPDPGLQGTVNEFRIYNGVLHADEILADYLVGPNNLPGPPLSATVSAGNIVITWTTNGTSGFTLQSSSALGAGASWSTVGGATIVGANYQATVPMTGSAQFFRLKQ